MDDPVRLAEAQQGGERYCGVDRYRPVRLQAGTELIKLEPPRPLCSASGYFMLREEYLRLRGDAQAISEGVQVAPHREKQPNGRRSYDYCPEVSTWRVEKPLEAAVGPTEANPQYGRGGLTQVYIPEFRGGDPDHNRALGLLEGQRESLQNNKLDSKEGNLIQKRVLYHQRVRNQFCHLDQGQRLRKLRREVSDPLVRQKIERLESGLSRKNARYGKRIENTPAELRLPCPTYDEKNSALKEALAGKAELSLQQDRDIARLRENLMGKVSETVRQVVRGDLPYARRNEAIQVDELRGAYQCHQFVRRTRLTLDLRENGRQLRELEGEIGRLQDRKTVLHNRGKLGHVLEDPGPRIMEIRREMGRLGEEGRGLRQELWVCERQAAEFRNFLSLGREQTPGMRL